MKIEKINNLFRQLATGFCAIGLLWVRYLQWSSPFRSLEPSAS